MVRPLNNFAVLAPLDNFTFFARLAALWSARATSALAFLVFASAA